MSNIIPSPPGDASTVRRGLSNVDSQSFAGLKNFTDGILLPDGSLAPGAVALEPLTLLGVADGQTVAQAIRLGGGLAIDSSGLLDTLYDGTVTNVSIVTANGISGAVANPTTTPAITLTLGAITPSSVAATGTVTGSNITGNNTGDQTITLTGPVTGSGTGTFATAITDGAVTLAKLANLAASTLVGRRSGSAGVPEAITLGSGLSMSAGGVLSSPDQTVTLSGAVSGSGTTAIDTELGTGVVATSNIENNAVTLEKMAQMATLSVLGRYSAGTGNPQVIPLGYGLAISDGVLVSPDASISLTGAITGTGTTSITTTLSNNAVTASKIADGNVTLAKLASLSQGTLIGRYGSGTGAPQAVTVGSGLSLDASGNLTASAPSAITLTGAVTGYGSGTVSTTLTDLAVTPAKLAVADFSNLCTNPRGDFGTEGWGGNITGPYGSIGGLAVTDKSFAVTGDVYWSRWIPVVSNQQFYVSCDSYPDDVQGPSSLLYLVMEFADDAAGTGVTSVVGSFGDNGYPLWQTINAVFAVPAGKQYARALLRVDVSATGVWYFRNFLISRRVDANILGDSVVSAQKLVNGNVTYAKIQTVTAGRLLGRAAATNGSVQEVSLGSNLSLNSSTNVLSAVGLSGTNTGDQTITLTGDVTGSGTGSFSATIASNAVTAAKIADGNVSLAKLANMAASTLIGRQSGAGTGAPMAVTLGSNLIMSAGGILSAVGLSGTNTGDQTITLTGAVTGSGTGSFATTLSDGVVTTTKITDGNVTLAKLASMSASTLIGRQSGSSGAPMAVTLGSNLIMSAGGALSAVGLSGTNTGDQTITLTGDVTGSGTGSFAATIASNAVTSAKLAASAVTPKTLGVNDLQNLCTNPGGEFNLEGWDANITGPNTGVGGLPATVRALRTTNRDAYFGGWFPVVPGQSFYGYCEFYPAQTGDNPPTGNATVMMSFAEDSSGTNPSFSGAMYANRTSATWQPTAGTMTVPAGKRYARLMVQIEATAGSTGSWYFRNYRVVRRVALGQLDPSVVTEAAIVDNAVTYAKMQTVTASRLLGRWAATTGTVSEIQVGTGLTLNSSTGVLSGNTGTVTSVTGSGTQGVSVSVTSGTTTPAIAVGLGAISPSSIVTSATGSSIAQTPGNTLIYTNTLSAAYRGTYYSVAKYYLDSQQCVRFYGVIELTARLAVNEVLFSFANNPPARTRAFFLPVTKETGLTSFAGGVFVDVLDRGQAIIRAVLSPADFDGGNVLISLDGISYDKRA